MKANKRPLPIDSKERAKMKREESRDLYLLLQRQRLERADLVESYNEQRAQLENTLLVDSRELERRHMRNWFLHRRKFGHVVGPAGRGFIAKGYA